MPRTVGALDEQDLGDLLPSQLRRYRELLTPSHALALAVLALAVDDLLGRGPASYAHGRSREAWRSRIGAEAAAWVAADDPGVPYSFASLCTALGLDPGGVRRALAGRRAA